MQSAILFYLFCASVCLSVCPMPILCQNEWTSSHFWLSDMGTTLVLLPTVIIKIPRWTPSAGVDKRKGMENACKYRHFSRKRYQKGLKLLWNTNRKTSAADRSMTFPMILSDLETRGVRVIICWLIFISTVPRFDLERPNLAR